ncbi:hypothetical protein ACFXDE_07780 [Kitasatospora sp. NPDC059408]|uniref:hypothetical protein n=1 Tax=Kitasatospora sp. NPDC059408 TaxID=3346823 RepID=UPI00368E16B1
MKLRAIAPAAGLLTVALAAAGTGWVAEADPATDNAPARDSAVRSVEGYRLVRLDNANVPSFQRRTVSCPAGEKALGGGAEARGDEAVLVGSFPADDGSGWIGLGRRPGAGDVGISVFVICAKA